MPIQSCTVINIKFNTRKPTGGLKILWQWVAEGFYRRTLVNKQCIGGGRERERSCLRNNPLQSSYREYSLLFRGFFFFISHFFPLQTLPLSSFYIIFVAGCSNRCRERPSQETLPFANKMADPGFSPLWQRLEIVGTVKFLLIKKSTRSGRVEKPGRWEWLVCRRAPQFECRRGIEKAVLSCASCRICTPLNSSFGKINEDYV